MSIKKQTAVEWLEEQRKWSVITNKHIEQAKAMEKEQIIEAFKEGDDSCIGYMNIQSPKYGNGEQYYNETYE